ncbi:KH domain-containing protein [Sesamum angolense]|uniref:KH domain-containing protein n=1 Tax=Sesamum angolense TaxID=2727404 RepID=A0AAE1WU63_9LAMI|nr:KH domain-containing protein [Sesamum angolense]
MGEGGKRPRSYRDDADGKNQKRRTDWERDRDEKGNDELIVYRILCPDGVIGSVIGKNGKEEVEIDEEFNDNEPLCAAQDALLKVHAAIANAVAVLGESDRKKKDKDKEECQLLVPSSQSANIIGKSGATIKKLRSKTRTNIKVTAKDASDPAHACALEFDNIVLMQLRKRFFAISAIMYKFTPKESIPLETTIPEAPPSIIIPSDVPIYPATGLYPSVDPINPARPVPSILGPSHAADIPGYADAGTTWPLYSSALPVVSGYGGASRTEELFIKVLCPSNKIGRVIGKGANCLAELCKATKATTLFSLDQIIHRTDVDAFSPFMMDIIASDDSEISNVEAAAILRAKIRLMMTTNNGFLSFEGDHWESVSSSAALGYDQRVDTGSGLGLLSSSGYGYGSLSVCFYLEYTDCYVLNRHAYLKMEKKPMKIEDYANLLVGIPFLVFNKLTAMGDNGYGSLSSHSSSLYAGLPPPSTLEMVIPAHAVGKVMGKGGTNIDNIRKISGAAIEISDSKSSRGDRVALISGTTEQKRAAENLIQAFIMAT